MRDTALLTRYRTFWRRFFAGVIDGIVTLPLTILGESLRRPGFDDGLVLAGAAISGLGYAMYSVLMHARFGQTVGKMATGVKVLDLTESRKPTLKQAFLRDVGWIILEVASLWVLADRLAAGTSDRLYEFNAFLGTASGIWFLLEVMTMLTNPKRRALHDYIAKTVVVRV